MDELDIVRGLMLRTAGALPASAPLAKALLEWSQPHRPWLLPDVEGEWNWDTLLASLTAPRGGPVRAEALELAGTLVRLLGLSPVDAAVLRLMVACDRLPRVGALARLLSRHGHDLPQLLGEMAKASAEDAERAARRGAVTRLGLACFTAAREGEANSLLFDRSTARTSWEVGQINELLTWLDLHPLPVVAATNHEAGPDPATLRRFVFKLRLKPLGAERTAAAFQRFFGRAAPPALGDVEGLIPGDFAVVARQLRHWPATDAGELVERLRAEIAVKPAVGVKIGF